MWNITKPQHEYTCTVTNLKHAPHTAWCSFCICFYWQLWHHCLICTCWSNQHNTSQYGCCCKSFSYESFCQENKCKCVSIQMLTMGPLLGWAFQPFFCSNKDSRLVSLWKHGFVLSLWWFSDRGFNVQNSSCFSLTIL